MSETPDTPRSDEDYILSLLGRIADLESELSQAQARCAELEKDAARYRWLRQSDCRDGVPFIAIFDGRLSQWTGKFADEQVDAAIDAALKPR